MARNSAVLIRQLLSSRSNPCAASRLHRRKLLIQNLTAVASALSSPQTIDIRFASKPFSFYFLHTPNLQFLQQRRCLSSPSISDSDSDSDSYSRDLLSGPSNLFVIANLSLYYEALEKVEDDRLSAVFYYTAPGCRASCKWVAPIFDELCEQFRHITMYKVYMDQSSPEPSMDGFGVPKMSGPGSKLDKLGIHKTPTFHCYLTGERVDELAGASVRHLKKRLENIYNPSEMKMRRSQGKKSESDGGGDLSQVFEVCPSSLPETSIHDVMSQVYQIMGHHHSRHHLSEEQKMCCFAKGMFSCQEKREEMCKLETPYAKVKWLRSEFAKY